MHVILINVVNFIVCLCVHFIYFYYHISTAFPVSYIISPHLSNPMTEGHWGSADELFPGVSVIVCRL